jgi:hypothetical protein
MTIGDPKKAIMLAVVAIVVIGAAVFRIVPNPEPIAGLSTSIRTEKRDAKKEKDLATIVISNAFWHPKLSEKAPATPKSAKKPLSMGGGSEGSKPASPFTNQTLPFAGPNPVESTGSSQQQQQKPTIRLDAIITTGNRKEALLTFGNDPELHKAQVGTKFGDLQVIAITETTVRIRFGKVEKILTVGEEQKL